MTLSLFGFLLIIGCLAARDEMLAAAQRKEFRRLRDAWDESHCPAPSLSELPMPLPRRARPASSLAAPSPVRSAARPPLPRKKAAKSSGGFPELRGCKKTAS